MKLKQVTVENFRCFEKLDIPLHPDINVFVGVNGSGKTAILDAIAKSLHPWMVYLLNIPDHEQFFLEVFSHNDLLVGGETAASVKNIVQLKGEAAFPVNLNGIVDIDFSCSKYFIGWNMSMRIDALGDKKRASEQLGCYNYFRRLEGLSERIKSMCIPFPVFAYYQANRRFVKMPIIDDIFDYKVEKKKAYEDALNAGIDYKSMCEWFYMRENEELRELKETRQIDLEYPDLKTVRQAVSMAFENVQRVVFRGTRPVLSAFIGQADGSTKLLSIEQLSDGYRNLLALVMDFAHRMILANPHLEKPLEAPGILIIDEIDLHLHPTWQQKVISNLRKIFPNTQLIVATHSPLILTTVQPECIHILKDFTLEHPEFKTYGADGGYTLNQIMGTESRPPNNENVKELEELFDLINQEEYEKAEAKCRELALKINPLDSDLLRAETIIKNRLWEKEMGL